MLYQEGMFYKKIFLKNQNTDDLFCRKIGITDRLGFFSRKKNKIYNFIDFIKKADKAVNWKYLFPYLSLQLNKFW